MFIKYTKWRKKNTKFSSQKASKIYQNWDFWYENIPSGNSEYGIDCQWASGITMIIILPIPLSALTLTSLLIETSDFKVN
jgi:hypothetical protein